MKHNPIDEFALPADSIGPRTPTRPSRRGLFVRAPLAWIQAAARLPGRECQVGLVLWFQASTSGCDTVHLKPSLCRQFGADRFAVYRALCVLERNGLVHVERRCGRSPRVTLCEAAVAGSHAGTPIKE